MARRNRPPPPWLPPKRSDPVLFFRWVFGVIASTGLLAVLAKCAPLFRGAM